MPVIFDIETTGLEGPMIERVTCISLLDTESEKITTFIEDDEAVTLAKFWEYVQSNKTLFGYNCSTFDFPFIHVRSLINNVKVNRVHINDLRAILFRWDLNQENMFIKGKLQELAKFLGVEVVTSDGGQAAIDWKEGRKQAVKDHCEEDVRVTYELYKRMVSCNMIIR